MDRRLTTSVVIGDLGNMTGMGLLFAGTVMPDSALADALRSCGIGWVTVVFLHRVRVGCRRRRPHWTRASWRRFLLVCSIPIVSLLSLVAMLFALEWKLSIAGAPRSSTRGLWVAASLLFMLIGAGGLAIAVAWFAGGEPTRQMTWPRWIGRERA